MRMTFFVAALCFSCLPVLAQQAALYPAASLDSASRSADWEEMTRLTDLWKQAYNSKDSRTLEPLYAENAQYISSHVNGYIAEGRDKVLANFQRGMSGGGHIDSITVLSIHRLCDMISVLCRYDATNSGIRVNGRNLLVSQKIGGRWLIVTHMTVVHD